MGPKRKKSISEKVEIILEIDNNRVSANEVARKFDVARSTLYGILKMKKAILAEEMKIGEGATNRKSMKNSPYDQLERLLYSWFQSNHNSIVPVKGLVLRQKAVSIAQSLNLDKFKASNGWMARFKIRHGLMCKSAKIIDDRTMNSWKEKAEFVSCDVDVNMENYSENNDEICSDIEAKDDLEAGTEKDDELYGKEVKKGKVDDVVQEIDEGFNAKRLENEHIPTFEETVASFDVIRQYIISAGRDRACLMRLTMLEQDILDIHRRVK